MSGWIAIPEEIIQMISSYLDLEDILKCTSVCKRWRNALNASEKFWREQCAVKFNAKKLTRSDQEFQTKALEKMTKCEELMELKTWRWKFIRENLLYSNWLEKGFKSDTLGYLQVIYPLTQYSCNGKYLAYPILRALNIMQLTNELTNIHTLVHIKDMNVLYFSIVGSIFAYVENHKVFIYKLIDSNCELLYQASIKHDVVNEKCHRKFAFELYTPHPRAVFQHNEKHFVTVACEKCERRNQKIALLYIWDLKKNVKTLKFFKFGFPIKSFKVKLEDDTIWVVASSYQNRMTLLRYYISSGAHKRIFSLGQVFHVHIGSNYITTIELSTKNVQFRDKHSGKICATFDGNEDFSFIEMKTYYPYCIFLLEELHGMVKVIDMEKFTEDKLYLSDVVTAAHFLIPKAHLVLFAIGKSRRLNMQIWDIKKGVALKQLDPSLSIIYASWNKIIFMNIRNQLERLTLDKDLELIKPEQQKREYFALKDTEEDTEKI